MSETPTDTNNPRSPDKTIAAATVVNNYNLVNVLQPAQQQPAENGAQIVALTTTTTALNRDDNNKYLNGILQQEDQPQQQQEQPQQLINYPAQQPQQQQELTEAEKLFIARGLPGANYLGQGAMSTVYAAGNIAVKVAISPKGVAAARRENNILQHLQGHPNIVKRLGFLSLPSNKPPTETYLFMETADCSVSSFVYESSNAVNREQIAAQLTRQMLLGLRHMHRNGILHRDIKADNLLIFVNSTAATTTAGGTFPFTLKLADFGVSIHIEKLMKEQQNQQQQWPQGTAQFMPQEVIRCCEYSEKSDVWAGAGCTVLQMLNGGKSPWTDEQIGDFANSDAAVMGFIGSNANAIPNNFGDGELSAECRAFLARALVRDPEQRASVQELLNDPWLKPYANSDDDDATTGNNDQPGSPTRWYRDGSSSGDASAENTVVNGDGSDDNGSEGSTISSYYGYDRDGTSVDYNAQDQNDDDVLWNNDE